MSYKLIYFDIDGTLVDGNRTILPSTLEALDRLRKAGIGIGIATGRMPVSAHPYVEAAKADAPLILYNGARIQNFKTGEVHFNRNLPIRHALRAIRLLAEFDIHCNCYVGDELYIDSVTERAEAFMAKENLSANPVGDLTAFLTEDPVKLLLIGESDELQAFREDYVRGESDLPHIVQSEPSYLELMATETTKGSALAEVSALSDVPLDEIVAFGDGPNDIEMIEAAGLGIAMGNAHPALKAKADVIAGMNDTDAISEVLDWCILE